MSEASGEAFDPERELAELRKRAYGPASDIDSDPAAIERLAELEEAHRRAAAASGPAGPGPSPTAIATPGEAPAVSPDEVEALESAESDSAPAISAATRLDHRGYGAPWGRTLRNSRRYVFLGLAAAVVCAAVVCGIYSALAPRPAAILQAGARTADAAAEGRWIVFSSEEGLFMDRTVDQQTLTPYGAFHGVAVWSAVDDLDNPCLILVEESSERTLQAVCTPRSGQLIADVGVWNGGDPDIAGGLALGSVLRFQHRGATVEAWVIEAPDAP